MIHFKNNYIFVILLLIILSCSRSTMRDSINMNWRIVEGKIDNNIILYEGYNSDVPLRGWVATIPAKNNIIKILISGDDDGVSAPSEIAIKFGASVIINGGYYSRGKNLYDM